MTHETNPASEKPAAGGCCGGMDKDKAAKPAAKKAPPAKKTPTSTPKSPAKSKPKAKAPPKAKAQG